MKLILYILIITSLVLPFRTQGQINQHISFSENYCIDQITSKDGNSYSTIHMPDIQNIDIDGYPALPVKQIKLIIPNNCKASRIEINMIKTEEITLNYPIKLGQSQITTDFNSKNNNSNKPNDSIYNSVHPFPQKVVQIIGQGFFREYKVVTIVIYPFIYQPKFNKITFNNSVDFTLYYDIVENESSKQVINKEKKNVEKIITTYIDNREDIKKFYGEKSESKTNCSFDKFDDSLKSVTLGITIDCDYVIITTEALAPEFNEFMAWKKRKGLNIDLVTVENINLNYDDGDLISGIDDEAGNLRQFLSDAYNNGNGILYALFAGDSVPFRYAYGVDDATDSLNIYPTDYYFADFDIDWEEDDDDRYGEPIADKIWWYEPEIFTGRLLVTTPEEIRNWTRKVILYESNPGNGNTSYLTKAYFTSADGLEVDSVASKLTWCNTIKIDKEFEGPYSTLTPTFPTGSDVINEFNNHYGIVSFFSHGRPTAVGVATKGNNTDDALSKYGVTSLDSYNDISNTGCCLIPENGNGFDNMTNYDYPSIFYSISCQTMPFDDFNHPSSIRNIGESFTTISKGGGPAYLGNTRDGFYNSSDAVFGEFLKLITDSSFYNLGVLEGISKEKRFYTQLKVKYTHNLLGCPETELWTRRAYPFQGITVTENGSNVTVNNQERGSTICIMSALDNGLSYHEVESDINVDSWTFTDVVKPYYVTVTKHNKIPYLKNLSTVLLENRTFNSNAYISCQTLSTGYSVDPNHSPDGNVVIASGASVTFDATENVLLDNGFEVELGATFEVK